MARSGRSGALFPHGNTKVAGSGQTEPVTASTCRKMDSGAGRRMTNSQHVYEVRPPGKDRRGVDLISNALPFGCLWYGEPNAVANAIGYTKHYSRSHTGVIRVYGRHVACLTKGSQDLP
jgi:hypothetical protein